MGSIQNDQKPHAVLVPYPTQGHVTPMMRIAKLLHARGFHVTFVNTEYNHRRLIRSKGPESVRGLPDFRFQTIPDGLPPSDVDATQDVPMLCYYTRLTCLEPFRKLLSRLNTTPDVPPASCVVSDGFMTFAAEAAREMGIPDVQFWTASVCSFVGYLHYREIVRRGIVPFKDDGYLTDGTLNTPVDWIPGMKDICLKDLPSFIRTTDPGDIMFDFLGEEAQACLKASAVIFNTFDELEREALDGVVSKFNYTNMYTIGPLHLLPKDMPQSEAASFDPNLWKEDSKVFDWLDRRPPESVIYVNYGSVTKMTGQHFQEFAWGLARSNQPFLWITRPDIVFGESSALSEEFLEEIKDRGFMASWCAQEQVLAHKSVGAFLSHCGWNSTLESISYGVPVLGWPFLADQQTNCLYVCEKWGIGMEIDRDVKRDEVAEMVREMMVGEKGKKMRVKAKEWRKRAEGATSFGGGSYGNFDKFIKDALHFEG